MRCLQAILSAEKSRREHFSNSIRLFYLDVFFDKVNNAPVVEYDKCVLEDKRLRKRNELLVTEIKQKVATLKSENCFYSWLQIHYKTCMTIMKEKEADSSQSTRSFVAEECLADWKKVEQGSLDFAEPNVYYLVDYNVVFDSVMAHDSEDNTPTGQSSSQ